MEAGVYALRIKPTGHEYIGASSNLHTRRLQHFSELKRSAHPCRKLQVACDEHGVDSVAWVVLESLGNVERTEELDLELQRLELEWMDRAIRLHPCLVLNAKRIKYAPPSHGGGMPEFGERLRHLREKAGLSQAELGAKMFPVRQIQAISRYESGTRVPTLALLYQLAKALGCNPCDLLPGRSAKKGRK